MFSSLVARYRAWREGRAMRRVIDDHAAWVGRSLDTLRVYAPERVPAIVAQLEVILARPFDPADPFAKMIAASDVLLPELEAAVAEAAS